jgi:hypothetical protein
MPASCPRRALTLLTIGYMIARGLAKSGSREPYDDDRRRLHWTYVHRRYGPINQRQPKALGCGVRLLHGEERYMTDVNFGSSPDTGSATDQVKDQVRDKAQVAQDKARGAAGQARGRLSDQVDQRSTQAGERVAGTASDVRSIAEELRSQGKDAPANLAEQVAGQADRVGDYLKDASGDRILRDAEDFARRQPMLVAAGALALGFAASRFLKASSSRRYESSYGGDDGSYRRTYATSAYGTGASYGTQTSYGTGARYETEVPYAESTTPAAGTPVVGTYDPDAVPGEPVRDPLDDRRS